RWRRAEVAPQHGRVRRRSRALQVCACQTEARISHLSWSKAYARLPLSAFRRICVSEPFNYRDFWRENRLQSTREGARPYEWTRAAVRRQGDGLGVLKNGKPDGGTTLLCRRSEEHTSELQSPDQ